VLWGDGEVGLRCLDQKPAHAGPDNQIWNAGTDHAFGAPTGYELVHEGKRCAPRAVVGLACRELLGRVLRHDEFSGGVAPGQANFVLRKLPARPGCCRSS
jgi:hypothetical protein